MAGHYRTGDRALSQFIGRGEELTGIILRRLFQLSYITPQVPIDNLITADEYHDLDEVYQKHKFDFVLGVDMIESSKNVVVEVNYKHGPINVRKWNKVFVPLLLKNGYIPVTINDFDCRSLFKQNNKKEHKFSWDDFRDLIDALEQAGITP